MRRSHTQRIITGLVLFCFVFVVALSALPQPAHAQIPVTDAPLLANFTQKDVRLTVAQTIWSSALVGLVNAATLMAQKLAYDAAVGLSTGCKGENACAFVKHPGDYFTATAFDAAGEFLASLQGPWEELGLNLCSPRLPDIGLAISLGIAEGFQPRPPRCNFKDALNSWSNVVREIQDPNALLKHVSFAFDGSQTDIGQAFRAQEAFRIQVARKQRAEAVSRLEGGGVIPITDRITGNVRTPAEVQRENFRSLARRGESSSEPPAALDVAKAAAGPEVGYAILQTATSTFLNTLTSRLLKMALQGIFGPGTPTELPDLTKLIGAAPTGSRGGDGVRASAAAVGLLTPTIKTSSGAFDYVTLLSACPQGLEGAGQFNCVIDQKFMLAIQQASAGNPMTVAEAIKAGYLDEAKPFGFVNVRDTPAVEPGPEEGYAYSAMKKLRLLRIVPLGWELAALKIKDMGTLKTLQDVVDGWAVSGSDFYHLVDPNWVLKAPIAQCGAQVFGARLDGSKTGREEECADLRHCIAENDRGECRAFGYCVKEKNTWRFDADSCEAQYVSCDTFRQQGGPRGSDTEISLLENTVDFGSCNADNAGCTRYQTRQTFPSGTLGGQAGTWDPISPALYLDQDAPVCDTSADGCTELRVLATSPSVRANVILNSGFERPDLADGGRFPDHWELPDAAEEFSVADSQAFEGSIALHPDPEDGVSQRVSVQGGRTYTLSVYAKGTGSVRIKAVVRDASSAILSITPEATSCTLSSGNPRLEFIPSAQAGNGTTYVRQSCSITLPSSVATMDLGITAGNPEETHDVWVDALQLEEGANVTAYEPDPFFSDAPARYFRLPSDYLNCTGEEGQRPECETDYAKLCRQEEVGCESYTPQGGAGDPAIPAIAQIAEGAALGLDECPQECVGYATYIKQSSRFEPQFIRQQQIPGWTWPGGAPEESLYLIIPQNARACDAAVNGCDEFTNLRTEGREYYTDLRACQAPAADSHTYFTWEGSDTSGYQLKTWNVKKSNQPVFIPSGEVCNISTGETVGTCGEEETGAPCTSNADCVSEILTPAARAANSSSPDRALPPCTNYRVLTSTGAITVECIDNRTIGSTTYSFARCTKADSTVDPDCRGFYDERGNIFYRLMSRTIVSTGECQSFRWTGFPTGRRPEVAQAPGESAGDLRIRLEQAACNASHGSWDNITHQCIYVGAPSLSQACTAEFAGCRGFQGNTGSNVAEVLRDTFEPPAGGAGWSAGSAVSGAPPEATVSSEALEVGRHSLKVRLAGPQEGSVRTLRTSPTGPSLLTEKGTYVISFNAKGLSGSRIAVLFKSATPEDSFGEVTLAPEWDHFELGPLTLRANANGVDLRDVNLVVRNAATSGSAITFFIDDIVLKRVQDTLYLVNHSWFIPESCDRLSAAAGGAPSRGAMLGCRAYTDRAGAEHDLKSFSNLCRPRSVGCTDLIDTRNSASPWEQSFNIGNTGICRGTPGACRIDRNGNGTLDDPAVCTIDTAAAGEVQPVSCVYNSDLEVDNITVPADRHQYVVIDPVANPGFSCRENQKGCQVLGARNASGTLAGVAVRNDPDRYGTDLCHFEEEGCAGWKRTDQSLSYFKAPAGGHCEYRTNVRVGRDTYSGWFRKEKQPVIGTTSLRDSLTECESFGTWNPSIKGCVDSAGNTVTAANTPGWVSGCNPDACGGTNPACVNCARYCNSGIGGKWIEESGVGTCVADTPCYGTIEVTGGSPPLPRLRLDTDTPRYLTNGTVFGVWKNADPSYDGRVGLCPKEQATCTEFLDPTDTLQNDQGQPYYRKENARVQAARRACSGEEGLGASRKTGCVLFNHTEDPRRLYDAEETYARSEQQGGAAVVPRPGSNNDANTVIKVVRDRECAEWLYCSQASFVWDEGNQKMATVCQRQDRCAKTPNAVEGGNAQLTSCEEPVFTPVLELMPAPEDAQEDACDDAGGEWIDAVGRCNLGRLKLAAYKKRDTRFQGREFSGYAIPDAYPIEKLTEFNVGTIDRPDYRLAYVGIGCTTEAQCDSALGANTACVNGRCVIQPNGLAFVNASTTCTTNADCSGYGTCIVGEPNNGRCTYGANARRPECRGFPEKNSPFPNTEGIRNAPAFQNVALCQSTHGQVVESREVLNCGCNYAATTYGAEKRYFNAGSSVPGQLCLDGTYDGRECTSTGAGSAVMPSSCESGGGACALRTKTVESIGWQGYCLETDPARPIYNNQNQQACLAWWPVDRIVAAPDIYNQHVTAGYQIPPQGGQYWCLQAGAVIAENLLGPAGLVAGSPTLEITGASSLLIRTFKVPDEVDIRKYEIKSLTVSIQDWLSDPFGSSGGVNRDTAYEGNYYLEADKEDTRMDHSIGNEMYEAYYTPALSAEDWWWWAIDDNGIGGGGPAFAEADRMGTFKIKGMVDDLKGYALGAENATGSCGDVAPTSDENYDGAVVMFNFGDNQRLRYIRLAYCSSGADDGDGFFGQVRVRLHPQCEVVAQADPKQSAPWTERLWQASVIPYKVDHVARDYVHGTGFAPFGSSSSHTNPPTSGTTYPWFVNWNRMETDAEIEAKSAFAGWPFACGDSISEITARNLGDSATVTCVNPEPRRSYTIGGLSYTAGGSPDQFFDGGRCGYEGSNSVGGDYFDVEAAAHVAPNLLGYFLAEHVGSAIYTTSDLCTFLGGTCRNLVQEKIVKCTVNTAFKDANNTDIVPLPGPEVSLTNADPQWWNEAAGGGSTSDDFSQLFGRAFKTYFWRSVPLESPTNYYRGHYQGYNADAVNVGERVVQEGDYAWDIRTTHQNPPTVVGANTSSTEDPPPELAVEDDQGNLLGITVNGQYGTSALVTGNGGSFEATVAFYAWADNDHMPLRYVAVDWDNGQGVATSGLYRNHMQQCLSSTDELPAGYSGRHPPGFGTQKESGGGSCEERPFTYTNKYTCEKDIGPNWKIGEACPDPLMREQFGGCCVFQPAVQVRDNWGYCNGFYSATPTETINAGINAIDGECEVGKDSPAYLGGLTPWAKFLGKIAVGPRE